MNYPVTSIGLPKTVDNDLPFTDTCPGFGSVAKFVATTILEASMDVRSMASNSTKVFIMHGAPRRLDCGRNGSRRRRA